MRTADFQPTVPAPCPAAPRHFAGELIEKNAGCTLGMHQMALRLLDDEGASHIVYIAHGNTPGAAERCLAQYHVLEVGARYHGSATLHRRGDVHHFWMGRVALQPCKRRPRFAQLAAQAAAVATAAIGGQR